MGMVVAEHPASAGEGVGVELTSMLILKVQVPGDTPTHPVATYHPG